MRVCFSELQEGLGVVRVAGWFFTSAKRGGGCYSLKYPYPEACQ